MTIYSSSNEFGLYFIQTDTVTLDACDREAQAFRQVNFPELVAYATKNAISGYIWLDMVKQPEGYYLPVVPE